MRLHLVVDDFLFTSVGDHPTGYSGESTANRFASENSGYVDDAIARSSAFGGAKFAIASPPVGHTAASDAAIDHPGKIGIGTWDIDAKGTALDDLERFDFGWYYNWQARPLWNPDGPQTDTHGFVPMIWGKGDVTATNLDYAENASSDYLLGFNEPDNSEQADMTVGQALKLWPRLMSTDKLLGSPATMTSGTLGEDSWLGHFMDRADAKGYDVDFVAVHYYTDDPSISAFKHFLQDVREEYHKPVWVTEWALVEWGDPDHFSPRQVATFAENAVEMMDDLGFVKRHAWFGAYSGGEGWDINTELIDDQGRLTKVGETFADLTL
jgi:hypothetical protein